MNNFRKVVAIVMLLLLCVGSVNAQTASIPNILNAKSVKQSGQIIENDKLVGYFVFYFKEKEDRKTSTYEVEIFDDNYNSVKSFELTRPKNSYLMETVYNGDVFLLFFYDYKTGYEYVTYDRNGEVVGKEEISKSDISNYDIQRSAQANNAGTDNVTFFPLENEGFVRQAYNKNKKVGYEVIAYDNEMAEIWKYGSPLDSKLVESVEISEVSEKYISATVSRKKSLMTKKMDNYFILLDAKTGELIVEMEMGNAESGKQSILKTYYDEVKDVLLLIGEYYEPGDDILKDKSEGLFVKEISTSGEENSMTKYSWKEDIGDFIKGNLTAEEQKQAKNKKYMYFHDVIRSENGNIFLIGEQFRKQISAGGTAMNILVVASGGRSEVSNFELRLGSMVVIELNKEYEIEDFSLVKKKSSSVFLPAGAGFYNPAFLGYYVKMSGGFDYSFTSRDKENDKYTIVYIDANRKEKDDDKATDKADKMLGLIDIQGGEMEATRVPLNTEAKRWWIQPAKPGYVSITEYFKKEKTLEMRLEQLTY